MNYLSIYKKIGVLRQGHMMSPRVIDAHDFKFNVQSSIIATSMNLTSEEPFFIKSKKIFKSGLFDHIGPIGKFKKLNVNKSKILRQMAVEDKNATVIKNEMALYTVSPNKPIVIESFPLDDGYIFKGIAAQYDALYSKYKTIANIASVGMPTGRIMYIHIPLPDVLSSWDMFKRSLGAPSKTVLKLLPLSNIPILFIMRMLSKYHVNSPFVHVEEKSHSNVVFLFTHGNNMTLLDFEHLVGLIKDSNTSMKKLTHEKACKLFLLYMLKIKLLSPIPFTEELDSNYEAVVGNLEGLEDQSIDDMLSEMEDVEQEKLSNDSIVKNTTVESAKDIVKMDIGIEDQAKAFATELFKNGEISEKEYVRYVELIETDSELQKYEVSEEELRISKDDIIKVPDVPFIKDKSLLTDSLTTFDKKYLTNILERDSARTILSLKTVGLNTSIKEVEDAEDYLGATRTYTIEFSPIKGQKFDRKVVMPIISDEGIFRYTGNEYVMSKQSRDRPITKVGPLQVSLTSYYGKLFVNKAKTQAYNIGSAILKQLRTRNKDKDGDIKVLITGPQKHINVHLPLQYSQVSRSIKAFKFKGININLRYEDRFDDNEEIEKLESNELTFFGKKGKTLYFVDMNNYVHIYTDRMVKTDYTFFSFLKIDESKLPVEFSSVRILGEDVPVALLLSYYYGLDTLLKMLRATVLKVEKGKRYTLAPDEYMITFADVKYVLKKSELEASMILGGFNGVKNIIKYMDSKAFNSREGVVNVGIEKGWNSRMFNEFTLLDAMFVDPMTKDLLKAMKEPTTFRPLILRASELLLTDYMQHPRDMSVITVTGYERVNGFLYKELVSSTKEYYNTSTLGKKKFNLNPYSVITNLQMDSTVMLNDDTNPITTIKQKELITSLGAGGRSKETMSKETRAHHPSQIGVISEAGKDSSDVGITNYLSSSPDISNLRGLAGENQDEFMDPGHIFSTSSLLQPGGDIDSPNRVLFSGVQQNHVIAMKNQTVVPFRTGEEYVIANKASSKFATTADEDGIIEKVDKRYVYLKGKSGKVYKHRLYKWTSKEVAGSTYEHDVVTLLKEKTKVNKGDVITYDKTFFEPDLFFPNRVVYKTGMLLNVALVNKRDTDEDSTLISRKAMKDLVVNRTTVRSIPIKADSEVRNIVNVGDNVQYDDKLLTIVNMTEDDVEGLSETGLEILSELKNQSPLSKKVGKITKISIVYNCEKEEMSKSILDLVNKYEKNLQHVTGRNVTGRVNSGYSINGKKLPEGMVEIKIYINGPVYATPGNKIILANQLKAEVSGVYKSITTEDGREVDMMFDRPSIGNRIVGSPDLIGTTVLLCQHLTKEVLEMANE